VRALECVLAGDTVVAHKHGIAVATLRTHLAHIFDKTRQADLIRLAAKFSAPVSPPGAP
jgi:hypothetical protein